MADEFVKGLGILTTAGLAWMTLASWYRTPAFEGPQLSGPVEATPTVYGQLGVTVMNGLFWFAVLGALAFWVVVPLVREARAALGDAE